MRPIIISAQVANNLLEYVLSLNNTWIVTQRTVVEWMQDPGALRALHTTWGVCTHGTGGAPVHRACTCMACETWYALSVAAGQAAAGKR